MKYLELAQKIALNNILPSKEKHFTFGCVALREDGAIVVSTNLRSMCREPSAHAEARVLRKAGYGSTIWVVRIDRNNQWSMAKPCVHCNALIKNRNVKRVYYSISPNEYGIWKP